ncbi:alpha/beta hydrolase [Brevibacterium permense]|uniref:alpha/beta hydrolase n=1 Tax=Brevibacterium permense TaxID=234834 RepID=UPI0021D1A5AD|nr:alpha/beta hydrolase [Brevibacterium permense]MCU4295796.1 alpha/beta hydrolase [Brevibacterium permense]
MTTSPLEKPMPPGRGRRLFTAMGYALRAVKALPAPLRERLLESATGSVTTTLPPFEDTLRLVEAAGGIPDGTRWQQRLLERRPHLRGVRTRNIADDTDGRVRARLYLPPTGAPAATAAFVWVHGGAFITGSLDQIESYWPAIEIAAAGIPVLSVDYRQALNGVHYPQPQDDVLSAWRWATTHATELGVTADQLHLGGASAGGCLVAGSALRLREAGDKLPASIYLAYPVLQGTLPPATADMAKSLTAPGLPDDRWVTGMFNNWAGPAAHSNPLVAPGLANPVGLPPTYVLTCGIDLLRRASEPYVERLREADVSVWQDVFPESRHGLYDRPQTADAQLAINRLRTWLTGGIDAMDHERF